MPITIHPDRLYLLEDPTQYDDDFGTGYGFAWFDVSEPETGMYVMDAWIVNERGDVHPGYDQCPIPLLIEGALRMEAGQPLSIDMGNAHRPVRYQFGGWRG